MKKYLPYIITAALILIGGMIVFFPNKASGLPTTSILFVGQGCPHCKNVEDFIVANQVDKKVQFETKEVWYNQANAILMNKVWKQCGLNPTNMGVPLYWDGSTCYNGEIEIVDYLKSKIK
ncbi:MAG: hypothetical protein ACD_72C00062G0001 [uncultured bacterium]|nr:MAG: hypothetical protein ACD_72C00062G0001 [uncultured bacterium]